MSLDHYTKQPQNPEDKQEMIVAIGYMSDTPEDYERAKPWVEQAGTPPENNILDAKEVFNAVKKKFPNNFKEDDFLFMKEEDHSFVDDVMLGFNTALGTFGIGKK